MNGFILVTLQLISWASARLGTSGSTWAYTNRKPQTKCSVFGDASVNASLTHLKGGSSSSANVVDDLVTVWLNDITAEEAELYRAEYGDSAYIDIRDPQSPALVSVDDYKALVTSDSDSTGAFAD